VQVTRQVAHWRAAVVGLKDLENFASAEAWRGLEGYLGLALRRHLGDAVGRLEREADVLAAELRAASSHAQLEAVRVHVLRFRKRYLAAEVAIDLHGDAVNSRTTPKLAGLLRACDLLALQSLEQVLVPLRRDVPGVLSYVDAGLGASVLRAGLRLYDGADLSPAALIKVTRQNLGRPTSLIHESGHQISHIVGWNEELGTRLESELAPGAPEAATAWRSWASELAADVIAFACTGYGSVAALHDVVSGGPTVFRHLIGDPHPVAYIRVLAGVQMCVRCYGAGPWDDLGRAWTRAYPLSEAPPAARTLLEQSLPLLPRIVELCLLTPMRAFAGRPLAALLDPLRVRPDALGRLAQDAGNALTTSPHWLRAEGLRLLALSSYRMATEPERAPEIASQFEDWMLRLGRPLAVAA
jgi:hypothetical protein